MAELNGNNVHINVNGVNVAARWKQFDMTLNIGDEDVSAGAGIAWEKHAPKLKNVQAKLILAYDDVAAATDFAGLWTATDTFAVIYGPEGNAAGKPCHHQSFKVNSQKGPTTNHDRTAVLLEYDLISTGVPTKNIYAGDTF